MNSLPDKYTLLLIFLFPLALMGQSSSQVIEINDQTDEMEILTTSGFLPDSLDLFEASQLAEMPVEAFDIWREEYANQKAVWATLRVKNNSSQSKDMILFLGEVNQATLYQKGEFQDWEMQQSGWAFPRSSRSITEGDFNMAKFALKLRPNETQRLILKLKNPTRNPLKLDFQLLSPKQWRLNYYQKQHDFRLLLGVVIGFLGIMAAYNFITALLSKKKIYFHYALYIISGAVFMSAYGGFWMNTVIGEVPFLHLLILRTAPCYGLLGYVLFAQQFLDTKTRMPRWHQVLNGIKYAMILLLMLCVLVLPFSLNRLHTRAPSGLAHGISQLTMLIFVLWLLFTSKKRLDHYFAIGASFFATASVFLAYAITTQSIPYSIALRVEFTGLALELITFSLGLGYKIQLSEKEKRAAQEAMSEVLLNQNEKLEVKVKERTRALEQKQEEILTQNEELHQQQEEIIAQRDYIEKQNKDLSIKNEQITDSIRYAQSIQEAVLPDHELDEAFDSRLIFYRPKDLVSGDFYWYEKVGNTHLVAVIDCTGHGVPGGFMSMIGFSILNDLTLKDGISDPALILSRLHETFKSSLKQEQQERGQGIQDGMDLGLCAITYAEEGAQVIFAGAKRPLRYVLPNSKELFEVSGSRKSIGGRQSEKKSFKNHELFLPKGSILYMDTDGFADQHNLQGKKYGSLRLKKVISELSDLPLSTQEAKISAILDDFQQSQIQRDDITLLGIKL